MDQEFLEKNESLVVEMGNAYLDKMELELGKKYKNNEHNVYPGLTAAQFMALKTKHNISDSELNEIYAEFLKLKPTRHLKKLLDAFHASGGNVDIEPSYDENTQRLHITVQFVIKDNTLETIEGLSPLEDILVKMNATLQIDAVLSGSDPDISPTF
ncbi:MAG: hypothetical protein QM504_10660 [Pseudomonadota bacterium]